MLRELMTSDAMPTVVMVCLGIVVAVIVLVLVERSRRKKLKALAEAFNGKVVFRFFHPFVRFDNGGYPTRLWAKPRSRNTPSYLIVEQQSPLGFKLTIDPRKLSLYRKIRILRMQELASIDPELTGKYIIRSNDPSRAEMFFMNRGRKEEVDFLFGTMGFVELAADNKKIVITKPNFEERDIQPQTVKGIIDALRSFASAAGQGI